MKNKGRATLAWHHFFRGLSNKRNEDARNALPRGMQK